MSLQSPIFSLFLLSHSRPPLWCRPTWCTLEGALQPLLADCEEAIVVRSTQASGAAQVKFGRLGWNPPSHAKWVFDSLPCPRTFHRTEIWCPGPAVTERERRAPSIFVEIQNPSSPRNPQPGGCSGILHVCLKRADVGARLETTRLALQRLVDVLEPSVAACCRETWRYQIPGLMSNSLQSLAHNHGFNALARFSGARPHLGLLEPKLFQPFETRLLEA